MVIDTSHGMPEIGAEAEFSPSIGRSCGFALGGFEVPLCFPSTRTIFVALAVLSHQLIGSHFVC